MKVCSKCGEELYDEAVVCPKCGCSVPKEKLGEADEINIGFIILSVLIPLFGIVWWAVKAKETPKSAKACGIAAIISWVARIVVPVIISVIIWVIYFILIFGLAMMPV